MWHCVSIGRVPAAYARNLFWEMCLWSLWKVFLFQRKSSRGEQFFRHSRSTECLEKCWPQKVWQKWDSIVGLSNSMSIFLHFISRLFQEIFNFFKEFSKFSEFWKDIKKDEGERRAYFQKWICHLCWKFRVRICSCTLCVVLAPWLPLFPFYYFSSIFNAQFAYFHTFVSD